MHVLSCCAQTVSVSFVLVPKLGLCALVAAFAVALLLAVRARIRTLPYDAYREVKR